MTKLIIACLLLSTICNAQKIKGVVSIGATPAIGTKVYVVKDSNLSDAKNEIRYYNDVANYQNDIETYKVGRSGIGGKKIRQTAKEALSRHNINSKKDYSAYCDRSIQLASKVMYGKPVKTTVNGIGEYSIDVPESGAYFILFENRSIGGGFYGQPVFVSKTEDVSFQFNTR